MCGECDLTEEILTVWKMYRNRFKEQGEEVCPFHCSANGLLLWGKRDLHTDCGCLSMCVHKCISVTCTVDVSLGTSVCACLFECVCG